MGMFDSVFVRCECGRMVEFQCKAGDCTCSHYTVLAVPVAIADALNDAMRRCKCGRKIVLQSSCPEAVPMTVEITEAYTVPVHSVATGNSRGDPDEDDCVMTVAEFKTGCDTGYFTDDDGHGYPVKDGKADEDHRISPSLCHQIPADATHVVWYNR